MKQQSIMVIAGEISGDMHAAELVRAIQAQQPDIHFFGIGGDELRKTGMEILYDVKDTAVLGFTDVLLKFSFFKKVFNDMLVHAEKRMPNAVLLVDYPGFNLRFAEKAHALGLKTIYYICPQVWAWRRSRISKMAKNVNRLMAIFPFEKDVFCGSGLKVDIVSHPLAEAALRTLSKPIAPLPWKGDPRIALLPGSRNHEVKRMLPVMWSAAALLEHRFPSASFIIAAPNDGMACVIKELLDQMDIGPRRYSLAVGMTSETLRQARVAIVASGTATIDAALMRCPMVIIYKTALATYLLGKMMVKLPCIGMVNIIAGKILCPELIQHRAKPANIASSLSPLIEDGKARSDMLQGLEVVAGALSGKTREASAIILEEIEE